jgi:hypothetical protein
MLADWTGLEPATSAVTGRHSNQLNYQSNIVKYYLYKELYTVPNSLVGVAKIKAISLILQIFCIK